MAIRTDLALEAREMHTEDILGVTSEEREQKLENMINLALETSLKL